MKLKSLLGAFMIMMFLGGGTMQSAEKVQLPIKEIIQHCQSVNVVYNGVQNKLPKQDMQSTVSVFCEMIDDAYEMPAFGVAINNEVEEHKKHGVFVEFCFNDLTEHNGMPFYKLLVEVNAEYSGFNIIRYYDAGYNGRCFYINLNNGTMKNLYNHILSLSCCKIDTDVS